MRWSLLFLETENNLLKKHIVFEHKPSLLPSSRIVSIALEIIVLGMNEIY